MVTGVSVIPFTILPKVLPVHGATTIMSNSDLGPIGSAPTTVFIISSPVISLSCFFKLSAFPNLVSNLSTEYEIIGTTFPPAFIIF